MLNCHHPIFAPAAAAAATSPTLRHRLQRTVAALASSLLACLYCVGVVGSPLMAQDAGARQVTAGDRASVGDAAGKDAAGKAAEAANRARPALVVGVVDIEKAIEFYPKAIAERERLQTINKTFLGRMEALTKQIEQVRNDMMLEKEGSDQREWKQLEFGELQKRREVLKALLTREFEREQQKGLVAIYEDLEAAIAEVAKRRGVHIVLRQSPTLAPEDLSKDPNSAQRQKLFHYDSRYVWYASEEFDLTPALINFLKVPAAPAPGATIPGPAATGPAGSGTSGSGRDGGERK
jgi:Skp family chaperone for outer membrane proteins